MSNIYELFEIHKLKLKLFSQSTLCSNIELLWLVIFNNNKWNMEGKIIRRRSSNVLATAIFKNY